MGAGEGRAVTIDRTWNIGDRVIPTREAWDDRVTHYRLFGALDAQPPAADPVPGVVLEASRPVLGWKIAVRHDDGQEGEWLAYDLEPVETEGPTP